MQAVKDMVADLSTLLDAHNRGEDTDEQFRDFMDKHGQFFPDDPQSIDELIDSLARRAAAQERMMAGLSPDQRAELADLMAQTHAGHGPGQRDGAPAGRAAPGPPGPAVGPARAGAGRRAGPRHGRRHQRASPSWPTSRRCPTSSPRATPGASLADIDEELLERALGRPAVDDLAALRQLERELERQGFLNRSERQARALPQGGPPARARRRCGGCSPSSTPPAAATTTSPTPAPPASSPAARGSGSSATSSRWTSSAR